MCFQEGLRMTFLKCRVPNVLFYQILFDKFVTSTFYNSTPEDGDFNPI